MGKRRSTQEVMTLCKSLYRKVICFLHALLATFCVLFWRIRKCGIEVGRLAHRAQMFREVGTSIAETGNGGGHNR